MLDLGQNGGQELHSVVVRIRRIDKARRIAYGTVYEPEVLDTYAEFMMVDDVQVMCHRFARLSLGEVIDTNHDNVPNGSYPVETFIARSGDPDFSEDSWVMGIKIPDDHVWHQVVKGELNGFSFEALVKPVKVRVRLSVTRDLVGRTEPSGADDHDHLYYVWTNEFGRVIGGGTSVERGHSHVIRGASSTEKAGTRAKHSHRFFVE